MNKFAIILLLVLLIISICWFLIIKSNNINSNRFSLNYYKNLQLGTPFSSVTEKIGQPDSDIGSGMHIFVYELSNNDEVWLGYSDLANLMYVKQKTADGKIIDLVK